MNYSSEGWCVDKLDRDPLLFLLFLLSSLGDKGQLVLVQLRSDRLQLDILWKADVLRPDMSRKDLHAVPSSGLGLRLARHAQNAALLVDLDVQIFRLCGNGRKVEAAAPLLRLLDSRAAAILCVGSIGELAQDLVEEGLHVFVSKGGHFCCIFSFLSPC